MIISNEAVAEKLSSYFETILENLELQNKPGNLTDGTLSDIIMKFENHPSIMVIKDNINKNFKFPFSMVACDEVGKDINQPNQNLSFITTFPQKLIKIIQTFSQTLLLITLTH